MIEITISDGESKSAYSDVMVKNIDLFKQTESELYRKYLQRNEHEGFHKSVNSNIKANSFNNTSITYFPIDRFYLPSWYNSSNYNKINSQNFERNIDSSGNNLIKYNISENIKEWLFRVFLERNEIATIDNMQNVKILNVVSDVQQKINNILRIILDDEAARVGAISRFTSNIPIITRNGILEDISSLSSGQMMMFSMFLAILKDFDESKHFGNNKNVADGICIIDEIDLNLHISQQLYVLPKLLNEFPKIQFIITTHSPFFIKGFKDEFASNCDIYALPLCEKVDSIYDFSQFKEAEAAFNDTIDDLKQKIENQERQINELINENSSILLVTEGITDSKYIKHSVDVLDFAFSKKIKYANDEMNSLGDVQLFDYLEKISKLSSSAPKILAIFDFDNPGIVKKFGGLPVYTFLEKRIYGLLLPKPIFRTSGSMFSIEHFFKDDDLSIPFGKYKLYTIKEFNDFGITLDGEKICKYLVHNKNKHEEQYILNGSDEQKTFLISDKTNVSLSKNDFCDKAIEGIGVFATIDWTMFRQLLDFIDEQLALFD